MLDASRRLVHIKPDDALQSEHLTRRRNDGAKKSGIYPSTPHGAEDKWKDYGSCTLWLQCLWVLWVLWVLFHA